MSALLAHCGSDTTALGPTQMGTVRVHALSDAVAEPFNSIRLEVLQAPEFAVATGTIAPAAFTLPSGTIAMGGDTSFRVPAGAYVVTGTALDAMGRPSASCLASTATANVIGDQATELSLNILCGPRGSGGLSVVMADDTPPIVTDISIRPGEGAAPGQPVALMVSASAPRDAMPLTYVWSVASAPPAHAELFQVSDHASFTAGGAGDYLVTVSVTDTRNRAATLTFPIHVTDPPLQLAAREGQLTQRPCREGDETLEQFAARCDKAMGGVGVPAFDCEEGSTEPPRQSDASGGICSAPNVLNHTCDPGSHFRVLHRNEANDGIYIVAHCRKKNNQVDKYGDIAAIQYNANTGATCFYQALGVLDRHVPAPRSGSSFWLSPAGTVGADPCVSCHDTGPFVRSPYLAQLGEVWPFLGDQNNPLNPGRPGLPAADLNYLPGTLNGEQFGPWNSDLSYTFVGLNFQSWEAYSITNSADPTCTGCHRLGASRSAGFWNSGGTAMDLGMLATTTSQPQKVAHGPLVPGVSSPIWMTPGQLSFDPANANHADAMRRCARSIVDGSPERGCSAELFARGDTCPPPPVDVNGATAADDPRSWTNSGKKPLGQPGGRIGFYYFTAVHGPFYQNSPWDPYMNEPPAVAVPPWDPPAEAPGFRGTYLRLYIEGGQWLVAWGLDATDIQNSAGTPPPPGGPGGRIEGVAFDQIDSIPDPNNCGSASHSITDTTGNESPLVTVVEDPQGSSAAILAGFIGNVARVSGDLAQPFLRVEDDGRRTLLTQTHLNNPPMPINQWFTGEAWANGCAGWSAGMHYAAVRVQSTNDVLLVPTRDVPDVFCYIDGIGGDWSSWRPDGNGGSVQPFAEIYIDPGSGYRLKVSPSNRDRDAVSAFATCVYLKN